MKHLILAQTIWHAKNYRDTVLHGIPQSMISIINCEDFNSPDKLRGICGEIVLHRTQSWYKAGWSDTKCKIRDLLQAHLVGRPNVYLTVINEVAVTNTTFLS
nr:hypothetical protein ART_00077 [Achromobacter phage vB_Ade_ART]